MTVNVQVDSTSGSGSLGKFSPALPDLFDRYGLLRDLEPELGTYNATHVYAINESANRRIEFSGSGLTYSLDPMDGLVITGGTITMIRVWTNDVMPLLVETQDHAAHPIDAVAIYSGIGLFNEFNDTSGLDAIFLTRAYDYTGNSGSDIFGGGDLNDVIDGGEMSNILIGYGGNDTLIGGGSIDYLFGGTGNDYLDGGGSHDNMSGGTGNDTYIVDFTDEFASELSGEGYDTVVSPVDYVLNSHIEKLQLIGAAAISGSGNELDNRIDGNSAANTLYGLDGADDLFGMGGNDTLNGGNGIDSVGYAFALAGVRVDLAIQGVPQNTLSDGNDTLISIEGVWGSDFNDLLFGNNDANSLSGFAGADSLYGRGGVDGLSGGAGNDTLDGGTGADSMTGGTGNDIYVVDDVGDVVNEAAGTANGTQDTIVSSVTVRLDTTTTAQGVEHVGLTGSANATVVGHATFNVINGNTGNNYLAGYNGNDTVNGGAGNDRVFGGDGKDLLTGGTGDDQFIYSFIADSGGTQPRRDVITDFGQIAGNNDWIDLALTDANGAVAGNQAFTWLGTAAFTGAAGELRYFQDVANNRTIIEGQVRVDAASPGPELSIELTGLYTLTAGATNAFDIIL